VFFAPNPFFGWGYAPDSTEAAYDAPPDPVVSWGGDTFGASNSVPVFYGRFIVSLILAIIVITHHWFCFTITLK